MDKFLYSIIFIFLGLNIQSQNTTSRLTIISGGNVNFYVNSFDKYNNGISYPNWTTVNIYFVDTLADGSQTGLKWKLDAKAMANNIGGILGNLPLNTIELEAADGGGPSAAYSPVFALQNSDVSLVTGGTQTDLIIPVLTTVNITYHCGKSLTIANSLFGKPADYYSIDILLTLGPE